MQLNIPGHTIGEGHPIFLVAEMSANHLQNFDRAVAIIRAAKKAGADAIKLQTYTPGTMTLDCNNEYFQIKQGTLWDGTTLYKLYQQAYTPWEWFPELQRVAQEEGLVFFSAAFDPTAVDFLEELGVPFHKVASFEITDVALVEKMAKTGKPMIISTGIASLSDIELAVETCRKAGNNNLILLKCTSAYPAPIEEANVLHIPLFQETFGVLAGLSDHTPGTTVPILSVGLGARMIEKHFTLDRASGGVDAAFSLEPDEFTQMVQAVRQAEKALG
ncbi:MAG TPA: pseudaminic acid synthase, partial [Thermotogota bacterium]|nr:pseudaminic acid synthase [Thermotogota bacterium]